MSVDSDSLSFPLKVPWQHAEPKAHAQRHMGTLTRTQRGTPVTEMQSASDACASTHADTPTTPPQHQGYTDTHSETHTVRARKNTQTDAAWPTNSQSGMHVQWVPPQDFLPPSPFSFPPGVCSMATPVPSQLPGAPGPWTRAEALREQGGFPASFPLVLIHPGQA